MKTEALKQSLESHRFDAAFGGARRDGEKSRAKERIFSLRSAEHGWNPKNQRPELGRLYNTRLRQSESMRVFPLSNWTELDVWEYIAAEEIPVVPLYFAKPRPVVKHDGVWIMVDDDCLPLAAGERPEMRLVRSRFDIYGGAARGLITAVLSGALAATAAVLILRKAILAFFAAHVCELSPRRTAVLTVVLGAALGVLVSISSVGAGALGVTAILLLYPRLPTARIVGSDIAHAVPLTLVAGIGHWMLDAGLDRLASARLTARRFAAGDRHRQLCVGARSRRGPALHIGGDTAPRRRQARTVKTSANFPADRETTGRFFRLRYYFPQNQQLAGESQ
jgi:hypothetical protein